MKPAAVCLAVAVAMMTPVAEPTAATNGCTCVEGFPKPSRAQLRLGLKAELDKPGALFLGQVVSVEPDFAILKIEKAWKGRPGPTVRMRHVTRTSDGGMVIDTCEYQFEARKRYLVLAEQVQEGLMTASRCGLTQPAASARQIIRLLDDLVKAPRE